MTEAEWLHEGRADAMLDFLRGKLTRRKLRLFLCACYRLRSDRVSPQTQHELELWERYADGEAGHLALSHLRNEANGKFVGALLCDKPYPSWVKELSRELVSWLRCALLHDVVGNPFRKVRRNYQIWLRWNDGTVPKIAQGIYEERAFDRLPILHDALLDAGCDNEDILAHCRNQGPHVRGCWVIDLILGKS